MHIVIALFCSCSIVLCCQHIPCADPFLGYNVLCCRLFRRRVRCARSLSCTQLCRWSWWTHLPSMLPLLSYLDGLKPYYCNKFSSETSNVISVWLKLCYKSFKYCVCQHYRSRDDTYAQRFDRLRSDRYTYIKCSQIHKSIQSDNNEISKGNTQFITTR